MNKPLKKPQFFFEDLPFKLPTHRSSLTQDIKKEFWVDLFKTLLLRLREKFSSFRKFNKRGWKVTITFNVTKLRIVLIFALGWAVWPHGSQILADPKPSPIPIVQLKPLPKLPVASVSDFTPIDAINTNPALNPSITCGDNFYANFIYSHESGCDTNRYNSIGCYGIGQSCPASKIAHCGADYICQNAWFSDYAQRTYGGWEGAYYFWLNHSWW